MSAQSVKKIEVVPSSLGDLPGVSERIMTSTTVLRMKTRQGGYCRLRVVYTPEDGLSRRTYQGPVLPGPYATTYAMAFVIDRWGTQAREMRANEAAGLEFDVQEGDVVQMDGRLWEIRDDKFLDYPRLYPLEV